MPAAPNPEVHRRAAQALLREAVGRISRPPPYVIDPWDFARLLGLPTSGKAGQRIWTAMRHMSERAAESPPAEFVVKLEREPFRIVVHPKPSPAAASAAASVAGVSPA